MNRLSEVQVAKVRSHIFRNESPGKVSLVMPALWRRCGALVSAGKLILLKCMPKNKLRTEMGTFNCM